MDRKVVDVFDEVSSFLKLLFLQEVYKNFF